MPGDLLLVFSNPTEGQESAYNEWYDQKHVPDVLSVPGVVSAQRYELAPLKQPESADAPPIPPADHGYLAVYELDRDPNEVMAEFVRRVMSAEMVLSEALDFPTVSIATWRPRGGLRRSGD